MFVCLFCPCKTRGPAVDSRQRANYESLCKSHKAFFFLGSDAYGDRRKERSPLEDRFTPLARYGAMGLPVIGRKLIAKGSLITRYTTPSPHPLRSFTRTPLRACHSSHLTSQNSLSLASALSYTLHLIQQYILKCICNIPSLDIIFFLTMAWVNDAASAIIY
ncbi:hypothetical protein E2C01_081426 [Portunus trituberculatus]|uniref:Uncharacterized protein n=1 Tax=Portunus trituberculatus TaxID=210409 RepID=A0A5B7IRX0_PORTR|nr:hypothetical protein [Portunus trituberculatus]